MTMRRPSSRLHGLADAQQAQTAASYAAAGAKAGSVVPGIGTVIGAVVGAVVGWLGAKKPPVRASAQQIAQCKSLVDEYMGYAAQLPNTPIPLDHEQLRQLNWCIDAIWGGQYIGLKDPRWFDPDVDGVFIPMARQIVRKIYETPVGGTVDLGEISFKDPKGRTIKFSGYSFVNPVFTDLKSFTEQYFVPMAVKMCKETAGKGAPGCDAYYGQLPAFKRWLYDLLAYAARTELPNISEADLKAASQVAATVPGESARSVVSAVEQIMGRTVQSGETAAALTPATAPPPLAPTVSTAPPSVTLPSAATTPILAEPLPSMNILPYVPSTSTSTSSFAPIVSDGTTPSASYTAAQEEKASIVTRYALGAVLLVGGLFFFSRRKRA